jgi:hypothetical protein
VLYIVSNICTFPRTDTYSLGNNCEDIGDGLFSDDLLIIQFKNVMSFVIEFNCNKAQLLLRSIGQKQQQFRLIVFNQLVLEWKETVFFLIKLIKKSQIILHNTSTRWFIYEKLK